MIDPKISNPQVGDVIRLQSKDADTGWQSVSTTGTIVYVNRAHGWYRVSYVTRRGGTLSESFRTHIPPRNTPNSERYPAHHKTPTPGGYNPARN